MDYEAKFAEAKRSKISQASSHMFLNLRHNFKYADHVISVTVRPQENRIFRSLKIPKKVAFYLNRKIFPPRFMHEM